PKQHNRESIASNRRARRRHGSSTALEDAAQIIGGRKRTAIRPAQESAGPGRQRHYQSKPPGETVSARLYIILDTPSPSKLSYIVYNRPRLLDRLHELGDTF